MFLKKFDFFVYLDCFDVLMLEMNFKKIYIKNIILMYFRAKTTLKRNFYRILKQTYNIIDVSKLKLL